MSKKIFKKIIMITICCFFIIINMLIHLVVIYSGKSLIVSLIDGVRERSAFLEQQIQEQREEVEVFFGKKGYDINVIGAYTNGREHEGPFSYGWRWNSFEIGSEVVMLYHYRKKDEVFGYLEELDEKTISRCYFSKNFLFYYSGNDENIINAIAEFCLLTK